VASAAAQLADQGARPADALAAEEFYVRTFGEPALDVHGLDSGSPYLHETVLPVRAAANVSMRLAPGQHVEEITSAFKRLLHAAVPAGAEIAIELLGSTPPGQSAPRRPVVKLGLDAFERILGVRPVVIG
jgi:acetylornithine deacetylase/succinyl-diaminopimelate desuccinylase-like protein